MAQFSGVVKIGDLNDFIAPSQSCVVSLNGQKIGMPQEASRGEVQLQQRAPLAKRSEGFQQTYSAPGDTGAIKVTLADCLACSGCVTSAETVLLQHQSSGELLAKLQEPGVVVVVSVSPQSRASLAALHQLAAADVQARLAAFFKQRLNAQLVLDLGVARDLALAEAANEFVQRWRGSHQAPAAAAAVTGGRVPAAAGAAASSAAAAAAAVAATPVVQGAAAGGAAGAGEARQQPGPLPMLASACPGWVCYAEKTQGDRLLPHIASGRSPQAVMGALVKRLLAPAMGWDASQVYHVSVMPCYDKKLEAARSDFMLPGTDTPEVDSSLTTGEVQELLEAHGIPHLSDLPPIPPDSLARLIGLEAPCGVDAAATANGAHNAAVTDVPAAAASAAHAAAAIADGAPAKRPRPHCCSNDMHPCSTPPDATRGGCVQGARCADGGEGGGGSGDHGRGGGSCGAAGGACACSGGGARVGAASGPAGEPPMHGRPGGSGGYLEFVFREAAWQLFGRRLPPGPLPLRQLRNADFMELTLWDSDPQEGGSGAGADAAPCSGQRAPGSAAPAGLAPSLSAAAPAPNGSCGRHGGMPLLRFAAVYGFRNIQTLVRQVKTGRCGYDYVEVMACPGGCLNGGGQLHARAAQASAGGGSRSAAEVLADLERLYYVQGGGEAGGPQAGGACPAGGAGALPALSAAAEAMYRSVLGGGPGSAAAAQLLHTEYHKREKTVTTTISDW